MSTEEENECRVCGDMLHLNDGCEWPSEGPICWGCLSNQRDELIEVCNFAVDVLLLRGVGYWKEAKMLRNRLKKVVDECIGHKSKEPTK